MSYDLTNDLPYNTNGRIDEMPFATMEVGQSFFVAAEANDEGNLNTAALSNLVSKARKIFPDKYFASKAWTEDGVEGLRVWSLDPALRPAPRKAPKKKAAVKKA